MGRIDIEGIRQDVHSHLLGITGQLKELTEESDFPIDCFPPEIQDIVISLKEGNGFPIDYTAASILVATSTCIGKSLKLHNGGTWYEPAILYCALVGRAGCCKSHPLSTIFSPLHKMDDDAYDRYIHELDDYEQRMRNAKEMKDSTTLMEKAPIRQQRIVSDVTVESLSKVHMENRIALCLEMDELMAWIKNFTRYNNGSEEQFWLSNFSSKRVVANRKGDKRPICIPDPFINVIGTIQVKLLSELTADSKKSNGFFDRILFAYSKVMKGHKWSENKGLQEDTIGKWEVIVKKMIDRCHRRMEESRNTISFSPEAKLIANEWQGYKVDSSIEENNEWLYGIRSKEEVYLLRFCLLLHELEVVCKGTERSCIDEWTVKKAIMLTDYFEKNALRVIGQIESVELDATQKELYEVLPVEFRKEECDAIAKEICGWNPRQATRFLNKYNQSLFCKVKHGTYRKIVV